MTTWDPSPTLCDGDACDVAVIGGGASGLAAAISCARLDASVLIIERDVELGLPILATGNGRCNISNMHLDPTRYRHPEIARAVMGHHPEAELDTFFSSCGIWVTEEDGRLYPYSKRAESVRSALFNAAGSLEIYNETAAHVEDASFHEADSCWHLTVSVPQTRHRRPRKGSAHAQLRAWRRAYDATPRTLVHIQARAVIIACGGSSADTATVFGMPHLEEHPVLCPIACTLDVEDPKLNEPPLDMLDGLRVEGALTLQRHGTACWHEEGEVLFRPYGLSGIAAFNLSRRARPGDIIALDLFPHLSEDELIDRLTTREQICGSLFHQGDRWFDGLLDQTLARVVRIQSGGGYDVTPWARTAKALAFTYMGTADERAAQVRRGGIPFDVVSTPSLRIDAACAPNAFACGEALDMDADCGGFNLAWAWLSGARAGEAAAHLVRREQEASCSR